MNNYQKNINSGSSTIYIIIILVLLISIVAEYQYFNKKTEAVKMMVTTNQQAKSPVNGKGGMKGMSMTSVTPPPVSDQQNQQLTTGISTVTTQKTFNITGGNFYFVPNKITVNQGDTVTFVMTNAGGVHNLFIDELEVKSSTIKTGEATSVTFVASKKGSFVYYCGVPSHRQKGMWGTLIVQ